MIRAGLSAVILVGICVPSFALELYVSPAGNDDNTGTKGRPFATITRARDALRQINKTLKEPVTVNIRSGTYYLNEPLVFTAEDSGSKQAPVVYTAADGQTVVLSGGQRLELNWKPYREGIMKAQTPVGLRIDQLFVNGIRQHMARYPNYDPKVLVYNGYSRDAFSKKRASSWSDPAGGFIHAMHRHRWGGYHYRITGKKPDNTITYEGGWQNNRKMGMHAEHRFVENIFEELDTAGEWFHDTKTSTLYYYPTKGTDLENVTIEIVRLRHLVEFRGSQENPVRFITLQCLTFRHTARTFMDTKEPLLRSDWAIYRGGAVLFNGTEDCGIENSTFDQVGGNAVFVNNYNRRIAIQGCHIFGAGASGVAFVGNPDAVRNPLFEYGQRQSFADIDKTPGPKTENYPADCVVEDCLIHRIGVVEKQATGVQISMSRGVIIRHCSIYDVGRAGINISEGTFGGHLIEYCDVFDTVLETGDHGSFNSWGRDRFWGLKDAPAEQLPQLALLDAEKTIIRNSRWRCDHGWDIDLDDGSSNYELYNNLLLRGGLKFREGFHRKAYNNIIINNSFHPHVWYDNSHDVFTRNIVMGPYRPAGGMTKGKWGREVDRNLFTTNDADRRKFAAHGCDENSIVGDPMFIDPANGDFQVQENSPAIKLGFKNFPMNNFGVQRTELKAIARTPKIPIPRFQRSSTVSKQPHKKVVPKYWLGAKVQDIKGEQYSAFGIGKGTGGVHLADVHEDSEAAKAGFKTGDVILELDDKPTRSVRDVRRLLKNARNKTMRIVVYRNQKQVVIRLAAGN
ncbi:MAG: PDZ domain-containing protein [Sedimentisphaerales bacterium]